ncbi:hypothetical protein DFJ74DRAFT_689487 [Hyaloraphidium curvatum]|nr:hypothetical protein DFJ74DRAFT_689487 [Hyaloraphidium curvatum]
MLTTTSRLQVFTTHTFPDYGRPWSMRRSMNSTSTGFIISKERILTNAHSVENWTQVRVRRRGSATKYLAQVIAIGRDCDIALLTVTEPAFWAHSSRFIDIGGRRKLPKLEERVSVVGYPVGGENLSVTSGVVSRIDMQEYANGIHDLLAIQVDAPINPGNSGGPVFDSLRRFVGIAFQSLTQAEGVGYIIPLPVIHHFLEDLARHGGRYTGFPSLMLDTQSLENPTLKKYLGVPAGVSGVLVIKIEDLSPCKDAVKEGDVLTEIDGWSVGDDMTVEFPSELVVGEEEQFVDDEEEEEDDEEDIKNLPVAEFGDVAVSKDLQMVPVEGDGAEGMEAEGEDDGADDSEGGGDDDPSQWEDVDSPKDPVPEFGRGKLMDTLARKRFDAHGKVKPLVVEVEEKKGGKKLRFLDDGEDGEGEDRDEEPPTEASAVEVSAPNLGYAERIGADFLVTQKLVGDTLTLTLFNKATGTRKEKVTLTAPQLLVPPEGSRERKGRWDLKLPSYRIVGGVVLTVMTEAYLSSEFGSGMGESSESTPIDLLALWTSAPKKYADEEVVLCAQLLAHDTNVGYEGLANLRLTKINGTEVRNLKQASKILDDAIKEAAVEKAAGTAEDKRYIKLEFSKGPIMVVDAYTVEADTKDVLETHLVPTDRSEDLVEG